MADWDILKDLLVDKLFGEISTQQGRYFAMLKETGTDATLKRVDIYDVSDDSILLNLDRYNQPKTLFKGDKGERCRCDYVLITKMNEKSILLFIEMKSSKFSNNEILRQFKGAECVMDYCNATLSRFHNNANFLKPFEKRFVVFYKPHSISKRTTRPLCRKTKNDKPEKAFRYPNPSTPPLKSLV